LSLHKYLYAGGDPVNFLDPSGMETLGETAVAVTESTGLQGMFTIVLQALAQQTLRLLVFAFTTPEGIAATSSLVYLVIQGYFTYLSVAEWLAYEATKAAFQEAREEIAQVAKQLVEQGEKVLRDKLIKIATRYKSDECPDWTFYIPDDKMRKQIGIRVAENPASGTDYGTGKAKRTKLWQDFNDFYGEDKYERDHFIPRGLGGDGVNHNINPLTKRTNNDTKGAEESAYSSAQKGCILYSKVVWYGEDDPNPALAAQPPFPFVLQPPAWVTIVFGPLPQPLGKGAFAGGITPVENKE
jgi:hypothetical protein